MEVCNAVTRRRERQRVIGAKSPSSPRDIPQENIPVLVQVGKFFTYVLLARCSVAAASLCDHGHAPVLPQPGGQGRGALGGSVRDTFWGQAAVVRVEVHVHVEVDVFGAPVRVLDF